MAFSYASGRRGNENLVTFNLRNYGYWSMGSFQYVYNPSLDGAIEDTEMQRVVKVLNEKWRSHTEYVPLLALFPLICIPGGFILFALTAVFIGTADGFPWNVPVGMGLFLFGGVMAGVATQAKNRAAAKGRISLTDYCNEINHHYKDRGIFFTVINGNYSPLLSFAGLALLVHAFRALPCAASFSRRRFPATHFCTLMPFPLREQRRFQLRLWACLSPPSCHPVVVAVAPNAPSDKNQQLAISSRSIDRVCSMKRFTLLRARDSSKYDYFFF